MSAPSNPRNPPHDLPPLGGYELMGDLTGQQYLALRCFAGGLNNQQTAAIVNSDRSTIGEWRRDPIFRQLLARLRLDEWEKSDQHQAIQERLSRIRLKALVRLEEVLEGYTVTGEAIPVKAETMLRAIAEGLDRSGIPRRTEKAVAADPETTEQRPYSSLTADELAERIAEKRSKLRVLKGGKG